MWGVGVLTEAARSAQVTKSSLYKNPFLYPTPLNLAHLGNQAGCNTEKEQHNPHCLETRTDHKVLAKYTNQQT